MSVKDTYDSVSSSIYNERYLKGYRDVLSGYEFARWKALDHLLLKVIKRRDCRTVLDYGSGSGLHVKLWQKIFPSAELHFCDLSHVAIEKLILKYPQYAENCSIVSGGIADIDEKKFDVVVSIEVLEHVEDLGYYLQDIYRLLKPGGMFVWSTPCANNFSLEHIYSLLTGQIESTSEGFRRWRWEDPTHLRRLKSWELRRLMSNLGFRDIGFRFRAHFFSFACTRIFTGRFEKYGEMLMPLDYKLFRQLPNGASMVGFAFRGN